MYPSTQLRHVQRCALPRYARAGPPQRRHTNGFSSRRRRVLVSVMSDVLLHLNCVVDAVCEFVGLVEGRRRGRRGGASPLPPGCVRKVDLAVRVWRRVARVALALDDGCVDDAGPSVRGTQVSTLGQSPVSPTEPVPVIDAKRGEPEILEVALGEAVQAVFLPFRFPSRRSVHAASPPLRGLPGCRGTRPAVTACSWPDLESAQARHASTTGHDPQMRAAAACRYAVSATSSSA